MNQPTRRPNILLMIADDHRYNAIRACGDPVVQTPVLDSLINEGTSFDRTHILGGQSPAVCAPARAALLTGMNPLRAAAKQDVAGRRHVQPISSDLPLPANFRSEHPFDNGELYVRDEQLAPWPRTPEVVRRHIADYYGMITHLDAQIGRVLAALSECGRDRDTIVVYTADDGLAVGQHGLL